MYVLLFVKASIAFIIWTYPRMSMIQRTSFICIVCVCGNAFSWEYIYIYTFSIQMQTRDRVLSNKIPSKTLNIDRHTLSLYIYIYIEDSIYPLSIEAPVLMCMHACIVRELDRASRDRRSMAALRSSAPGALGRARAGADAAGNHDKK